MENVPEQALVARCREGDREAFRILVERHKRRAYEFAFSYLKNADDALGVSQDAFVRAWRAFDTFVEGRAFRPWLLGIVKNLSLNLLEKKKRLREVSLDEAMEESGFDIGDPSQNPQETLERKETGRLVWRAIFGLKDEFREIIVLKHFHDMSYGEISETLGIPEGTVMSRLYYARMELKKKLGAVLRRNR